MTDFEKAFNEVQKLVSSFEDNMSFYTSLNYQEAEARKDFIDKFFIALGWDVNHDYQRNPYEQEVKVERPQKQQQAISQKRADYAFFLGPNYKDVRFFVEAKKPAVGLRHEDHYFQTVRYGWNANTPIAALTDFEEFHILDCRYKPDLKYIFNGQHKEFHFTDYKDKDKFGQIYWLFGREAVATNSLQKFAERLPKPKGKAIQKTLFTGGYLAIDDSFLEYIDDIREHLAKAFKKNDETLGSEELTEAVTRTIDRLVFIRFLEDKLIEPNNHVSEWRSWKDFISDCRKLDVKYNGVVFKHHPILDKKDFVGAEGKMFLDICSDISNLNTPYDFNYIPVHILGSIYERFLGKVVVATDHRVRIEEKPEVRKAGGVYYTPKYIVDYIVNNSIGVIIKGKNPKQISELKFADIACGSGTFLISVYECLLDYHKKWYAEKYNHRIEQLLKDYASIQKNKRGSILEADGNIELKDGQWVLTLKQKQEILLNNIFGVDIDRQAVEVTQLSLFLKMLEDETLSSTQSWQGAVFSKVLPDLGKNIVCGNSLIGTDILDNKHFSYEKEKKINPMDFEVAFPSIMRNGGFNAIVGNPPYVLSREKIDEESKEYYATNYLTLWEKPNTFNLFLERAYQLINSQGYLGYIIPNSWLTVESCKLSRKLFIQENTIKILDDLNYPVFKGVGVEPVILIVSKNNKVSEIKYRRLTSVEQFGNDYLTYGQDLWNKEDSNYSIYLNINPSNDTILNKILKRSKPIGDLYDVRTGLQAYEQNRGIPKQSKNDVINRIYDYDYKYDDNTYKYLDGKNVDRYSSSWDKKYLRYGKCLSQPRTIDIFSRPRILLREITNKPPYSLSATYFSDIYLNNKSILNILHDDDSTDKLKFLLGQLNSKLMTFYYKARAVKSTRKLFPKVVIKDLCRFPVLEFEEKDLDSKRIVSLVDQILDTKIQMIQAKTEGDKSFLESKCENLNTQLDNLIYKLHELSLEEITQIESLRNK